MINWYKKIIYSSNNIKFPEDLDNKIDEIAQKSVDFFYSNSEKPIYGGDINIIDPYTDKEDKILFTIYPFTPNEINSIAVFNPQKRIITIFPFHHNLSYFNENILFQLYKEKIYHEITHFIDPKFKIPDWWRDRSKIDYLKREEEFDAYSKEIEFVIKSDLNEQNREKIKDWLRNGNIYSLPYFFDPYKDTIGYWKDNVPNFYRMLKQRIYNLLMEEKENVKT